MTPVAPTPHPLGIPATPDPLRSRHWSVAAKLLLLLTPVLILLLVIITWYLPGRQKVRLLEQQVMAAGEALLTQVRRDRQAYLTEVLPRLLKVGAQVPADYHRLASAPPLPSALMQDVTDLMVLTPQSYRLRLISPWPINKEHAATDPFHQEGFRFLAEHGDRIYSRRDTVGGSEVVRFLAADRALLPTCVACHNSHEASPKRDFRLNGVIGGIELVIPIDAPLRAVKRDQWILLGAGLSVGVLILGLVVFATRYVVTTPLQHLAASMRDLAGDRGDVREPPPLTEWSDTAMGEEVRAVWRELRRMHETIGANQRARAQELQRQTDALTSLNRRLMDLHEKTQVIQQAISEEEVYRTLSHTLHQALPLRQIFILRLNRSEDHLELVWSSPKRDDLRVDSYPVWDRPSHCPVIRAGREYKVEDVTQGLTCSFSLSNDGPGSYWCIPLVMGGHTIGVVHLASSVSRCWTDETRQWVEALVSVAAPMIGHIQHLERAKRRALIDELTGAYNRRFLEEFLAKMILPDERRKGQLVSLLMLDLDHFKQVNDTYGHQVGDLVLKTVATTLNRMLKESDVLARYGGEEFTVVLPQTDTQGAAAVAERLRIAVAGLSLRQVAPAAPDHITVSVGVATYPTHARSVPDLIRAADEMLYQAKATGRNRVVCATAGLRAVPDQPVSRREDVS
ncbi:MAG TPA: diguanylate cyclase [Nitrospiraceae bacterium]|jgi:diguanylate cyclase (GGDEF)-like protein|nr:diguanylate cyclase [Nitrospiraceae bacterium]